MNIFIKTTSICVLCLFGNTLNGVAQKKYAIGINFSERFNRSDNSNANSTLEFTTGVGISIVRFTKTPRLFYTISINFQNRNNKINNEADIRYMADSSGNLIPTVVGERDTKIKYHSIGIPFVLHYNLLGNKYSYSEGKVNLFLSAGVEAEWLYQVKYNYNSTYDGKFEISADIDKKIYPIFNFGIGLYKPFANRWLLLIKPNYYSRLAEDSDNYMPNDSNGFAINAALYYQFL